MRCSCKECGIYMVQADAPHLGCVCPECFYRCTDCLGTNTVVSREGLKSLAFDPRFQPDNIIANFTEDEEKPAAPRTNWQAMLERAQREAHGGGSWPRQDDRHD